MNLGFRFQARRPLLEQLTADRLNAIVDAVESSEVLRGRGYMVRRLPGGQVLQIASGLGGGAPLEFPLQVLAGGTDQNIRVRRGSFNGVFATGEDIDGHRFQMHVGDDPQIDIPVTGAGAVWAHMVIDVTLSQPIKEWHLEVDPSSTLNSLTDIYKQLGSWSWADGKVAGIGSDLTGSQDVAIGAATTDSAPVVQYSRI